MSGHICQRVEEWAADERGSSGFPPIKQERSAEIRWIRVHPRPIAVTFNHNLLKEEAILEMCPDWGLWR